LNIKGILPHLLIRSLEAKQKDYTAIYGKSLMEKYLKGIRYTTRMVIQKIIVWIILNFLLRENTQPNTLSQKNRWKEEKKILRKPDQPLKFGIHLKKVKSGTPSMVRKHGRIDQFIHRIVRFVVQSTVPRSLLGLNTVTQIVEPQPYGAEEVYNLQTEDGMYFANEVLVSNCDALRYLLYTITQPLEYDDSEIPPERGVSKYTGY